VLPPLYTLAINLHGGWIQALAMLGLIGGALGTMDLRARWLGDKKPDGLNSAHRGRKQGYQKSDKAVHTSHLQVRHLALVMAACGLALLINPYGARLLYFPFEMQADWIRDNGAEWQSPLGNWGWGLVGGGKFVPIQPVFILYLVALVAVLYVTLRRWRTADLVSAAVMGLWLAMSLRHLRAVGDAVLLTAPFVAAALPSSPLIRRSVWPQRLGIALTAALALVSLPVTVSHWGWDVDEVEPAWACAAAVIVRHGLSGRLYADTWGPWFLWQYHPQVTIPTTWEYVAGPHRWFRIPWRDVARLPSYVDKFPPDIIVLTHYWQSIIPSLLARGWGLVHTDDWAFVLVAPRPETAELIRREGYRWLRFWEKTPITPANAPGVLAEAERAIQRCPQWSAAAWANKAKALRALGRTAEWREAYRQFQAVTWARRAYE
jgi:hypothetical protein